MTDFSTSFTVDRAPVDVTDAIADVASWWTGEVTGPARAVGDAFVYRYGDQHRSTQQVTELVPGRRVVWSVTEADLPFADDPQEWVGTRMVFDVVPGAEGTEVRFTHVGLRPGLVCYDSCSGAWTQLLAGNLRSRLLAG